MRPNLSRAIDRIQISIAEAARAGTGPLVVALDGGSGAGKSTVAAELVRRTAATIVPLDDFYAFDIPDQSWDGMPVADRLEKVFDWERVRRRALLPLLDGKQASWRPIDFEAGMRLDGTYRLRAQPVTRPPEPIVLLDGVYSAGPQLADLVGLSLLLRVPACERHQRLASREPAEFLARWHALWDEVEAYYFTRVRPPRLFNVVIDV